MCGQPDASVSELMHSAYVRRIDQCMGSDMYIQLHHLVLCLNNFVRVDMAHPNTLRCLCKGTGRCMSVLIDMILLANRTSVGN